MTSDKKDMDNSDYSLKWNNFTTNLTCGFVSHLSDNELVDVTLAVEGKLLQAHKLVLSVCSPYFKEIFKLNPCTHPVVVLKGMGYTQIEALLQFMYKGEVNISHNELSSFLKVAEELKVKGLAGDQGRGDSELRSGSNSPSPPSETVEVELDAATCSNPGRNAVETDEKVLDSGVKRPRESTARSRSLTPKRNRASPPALREMDAVHFIKAKSEPEDFELQGEPYFLDEPLEQYLNSQQGMEKGFPNDEAGLHLTDGAPSNSLTAAACSQGGEGGQGLLSFVRSSRGNLQLVHDGHIYTVHCRAGVKTYWKCIYRSLLGRCRARCYTKNGSVVLSQPVPPPHASHLDTIRTLCITGKMIYSPGYQRPFTTSWEGQSGGFSCKGLSTMYTATRGIESIGDARGSVVVEPVTYRLSARGRPQLVHEGYVYNLTSRSEVLNRSHYRCAEQHRGCRGKCAVIAERFMPTGVHEHNHPPGYQSEYEYRKKKGLDTDII